MRGTIGYLAPEWIAGQPVSAKADVYSFGMVLFELVSGRRNSEGYGRRDNGSGGGSEVEPAGGPPAFFPVWAAGKIVEGEVGAVADPRLRGDVSEEELERACRVACWCIQDQEEHCPTMAQVVQALEGVVHVHAPPEAPKWRRIAAYMANVKNGTPGVTMTIDGEEEVPSHNAMPSHPRGHKSTKADLSREASSIALSETLKSMMAESQKCREKETSAAIYIDLTKQVIAD
ncbi:hypothetical protein QYE76_037780 [Lolium multiflorum]|uniref:Protein kinase domain-containing protein n=1 Tax=Lolium multiflorum TaxID=4521 RepID=A0AAD8QHH2_LOLMU|nr:hypothetical protein QYE76_037780 [Lolium multiflorum]